MPGNQKNTPLWDVLLRGPAARAQRAAHRPLRAGGGGTGQDLGQRDMGKGVNDTLSLRRTEPSTQKQREVNAADIAVRAALSISKDALLRVVVERDFYERRGRVSQSGGVRTAQTA